MPRERSEWFGIVCIRTSMPPAACTPFADRQDMWTYPHERSEWLEGSMQELQELCSVATHAGLHDASVREHAEIIAAAPRYVARSDVPEAAQKSADPLSIRRYRYQIRKNKEGGRIMNDLPAPPGRFA